MNDKNFIEELRQKREEYGVTQTRLAVACGISREYYNRIEKGKQPLNDELKGVIEKQIERFNPQEPLFLLIDYFRVRFPTTDALAIIRDVLQLKPDYMLYEDYGKYGYESKYVLGDINVMCSMQEHLGVLLELKGRGCRQMESYLLAQERSWYDFMLDCLTAGGKMKRLDLAINDKAGILDIPKLKEKYKAGECISYFRMQKDYSGTEKCGSDLPKNTGETLYLGSTSSELCAIHVLYDGIDILGCALGGLSTWKLGNVAESYTTSMAGGGNRVISGIIGMVPVTFIVNTNVDRNDIDHPLHLYHRIELTFSTGRLCLVNTHGPVIWLPFLHMPRDEYGTLSINVEEEVNIPSGVTIGNVMLPSVKETFEQIWPDAVKKALEILFKQNRTEKMSMAQYQIYVSKLWSEICQKVGYMNIVDYDNFGDIKSIFYDLEKRHLIKKENDGIE